MSMTTLPLVLQDHQAEIKELACAYGLDAYETIFEMVDYDEMNMIAAYGGFPTRYPHWRFGMEYEQLSKSYTYGLSKIRSSSWRTSTATATSSRTTIGSRRRTER